MSSIFASYPGGGGAGGSIPTGYDNTLAYFNASGGLTSSPNLRWDPTFGMVLSTLEAGATTGNVGSVSGGASLVVGTVGGVSSILSSAFGKGNIVYGYSLSDAQISSQGNGSLAGGYATNQAIIATELDASLSMGVADGLGSQISANGPGTFAIGNALAGAILGAEGHGSHSWGYTSGASSLISTSSGTYGSNAGGYSIGAGNIDTTGNGAMSFGFANTSGSIAAEGNGSLAFGKSLNSALINCTADGAFALGSAQFGSIVASGEGSLALGKSVTAGSNITSSGIGSVAMGYAENGLTLSATANGAVAVGVAENFGITAAGQASFAGGFPLVGAVSAPGVAAFAFGDGVTGTGRLSMTLGVSNNNESYASLVLGRYADVLTGTSTPGSWVATDPLLVLGNGTGTGALANALIVLKNGNTTVSGTLNTKASYQGAVVTTATNLVLNATNQFITVDDSGGSCTITLPAASSAIVGRVYHVKKLSASNSTVIARTGSDTLDGAASYTMSTQYQYATVVCTSATAWSLF